ncbi:NAD-glutamate dehydrogenase domain-containing protein [Desulfogranum marinum]|uniref:NAD-glutamate dehydrogenase domain-containing protein n=1 Tax=Desulfogranum marinum TaxID=453220 RepID=UPI0029C7A6A0|nr:NAD-glutamate dehydrogenase domain-containing protein [Desulfogranum marinum]
MIQQSTQTVLDSAQENQTTPGSGADIINRAVSVGLAPRILYQAVIDLSSQGLITANCINMAAGILLHDLGLPNYFFEHIQPPALAHLLQSIATTVKRIDNKVVLYGRVAHVDFDVEIGSNIQQVRIATEETRNSMEDMLEGFISGHRREYYYSPQSNYYTYIIRPEIVNELPKEAFTESRFLFNISQDYSSTPEPTRRRYEKFLMQTENSVMPLIEFFNLPQTGETRLMFKTDFATPQLPVFRKLLEEHGLTLVRAYWEPYYSGTDVPTSICTLYILGELSRTQEQAVAADLVAFLAFAVNGAKQLYLDEKLSFPAMLFAGNAIDFAHMFIFQESENATDREILNSLSGQDYQDAFAKRIQGANKSTYGDALIEDIVCRHPDLIQSLFELFDQRFNPDIKSHISAEELSSSYEEFERTIASRFIDFHLGYDIFKFMFKLVASTLKTNFYSPLKRSFAFRFDNSILDPLVFSQFVYGVFYINGHYACGTHLRAADIARGGLRLIRVSPTNYESELDNAVLLNYALGPKAQRLKHKDICESGSKGVVVPRPLYAAYPLESLQDYTEGIMDLMLLDNSVVDYYGKPEMIFFGPDEGTALLMDKVAYRGRERGYPYWRTLTTGKSFGIPHDTYGLLETGDLFALYGKGNQGVDLHINGQSVILTDDMEQIYNHIGGKIATSGMTTTSVMSTFRTLVSEFGTKEEDLNLMLTGGPDGDLGANQIQSYRGKICLVIDGGSVLFDPNGLDKEELTKIAFMRHTSPRHNTLAFPVEKLSENGFMVPIRGKNIRLPDGTVIEDGAYFHRHFLSNPDNRRFIAQANIRAFTPCGGLKDTINQNNIKQFLSLFTELEYIVEGANVFFDDASRRYIATTSAIKHIKDSTANKGGVYSSSIAEILTAFLFQDEYEHQLLEKNEIRLALIKDVLLQVEEYARIETTMLLRIHQQDPQLNLFELSESTSESIFAFQNVLEQHLPTILEDDALVWSVIEAYTPVILTQTLGRKKIMATLSVPDLQPYRNAILTKKLASTAFYRFYTDWSPYLEATKTDLKGALQKAMRESVA